MKKQLIALLVLGSLNFINAADDTPAVLQGEDLTGAAESTQARIEEGARKATGRTMFGRADTGAKESVAALRSRFEQPAMEEPRRLRRVGRLAGARFAAFETPAENRSRSASMSSASDLSDTRSASFEQE